VSIEKIRDWFTPDEAADFLSSKLDSAVTTADVFQLVLDDRLAISVAIVNPVPMLHGEEIASLGSEEETSPHLDVIWKNGHVTGLNPQRLHQPLNTDMLFRFDDFPIENTGVFEVQMLGPAKQLIEVQRQRVLKGFAITVPMLPIILKADDKKTYALMWLHKPSRYASEPRNFALEMIKAQEQLHFISESMSSQEKLDRAIRDYYSSYEDRYSIDITLPEDSALVFSASNLIKFINNIGFQSEEYKDTLVQEFENKAVPVLRGQTNLPNADSAIYDFGDAIQGLADTTAKRFEIENSRKPTKHEVTKDIVKQDVVKKIFGDPASYEYILRRFIVTWKK
jgi:hypothetical protein